MQLKKLLEASVPRRPARPCRRQQFRAELCALQTDLHKYTRLLAGLADVEAL